MNPPLVYSVLGRPTVYSRGRRFLLPAHYEAGAIFDVEAQALPPASHSSKDQVRQMLFRTGLLNEPLANGLGDLFRSLTPRRRFFAAALALAASNIALTAAVLSNPAPPAPPDIWSILALYGGLALLLLWHEAGHCAAARRLGIRVDGMGAGLYLVFPAFFSSISLIDLLPTREKIIVYSGGVFFQLLAGLLIGAICLVGGSAFAGYLFLLNLTTMGLNLIPILHLDGYRILSLVLQGRLSPGRRRLILLACSVLTIGAVGYFTFTLGRSLWLTVRQILVQPTPGNVAAAALLALFLSLLLVAAPKWLRRPHG